jgi:hypothetical protein
MSTFNVCGVPGGIVLAMFLAIAMWDGMHRWRAGAVGHPGRSNGPGWGMTHDGGTEMAIELSPSVVLLVDPKWQSLVEGGKPPVRKTQYIQKWALGSNPSARIKVTIEAA